MKISEEDINKIFSKKDDKNHQESASELKGRQKLIGEKVKVIKQIEQKDELKIKKKWR